MSEDEKTFEGRCYCGAVRIVVTGEPEGAGYCHCAACRSWSAGPVNAFTLWKHEAVKMTQGEAEIGEYHQNERSYRQWCKVCGGHLLTHHPQWGLVDVYAATIPSFPFAPAVHKSSSSTVCDVATSHSVDGTILACLGTCSTFRAKFKRKLVRCALSSPGSKRSPSPPTAEKANMTGQKTRHRRLEALLSGRRA